MYRTRKNLAWSMIIDYQHECSSIKRKYGIYFLGGYIQKIAAGAVTEKVP